MQYRKDRYGNDISILGFGCMRLSRSRGGIDIDKAEREINAAIEMGINYFDTAYMYPGNEAALGEVFRRNGLRDKINIAAKLPQYLAKKPSDFDKYFNEELKRLQTDHIDYYLMHFMTDVRSWERLRGLGVEEWIAEKKLSGQIRQIGFSYHGTTEQFCRLVDAYDWDFCQIQYNYLDEHTQAGVEGLKHAAEKGLPVIIMEPLRGGKLAVLPKKAEQMIHEYDPSCRAPELSFRWLWNQPEVTCVLSGMNSMEMLEENVRTADSARAGAFGDKEFELIRGVVAEINGNMKVGCTGCQYCQPCPQGVKIPQIFNAYNKRYTNGFYAGFKEYFITTSLSADGGRASQCVQCGLCETHCPQGIKIRDELKNAKKALEIPGYGLAQKIARKFMKF